MVNRALDQLQSRIRAADGSSAQQKKEELKKVAHDFESLFVGYLLKVMRETIEEAKSEESGFGKTIYTELFDEELSKTIAQQGTFGIADMLIKRLSIQEPTPVDQGGKPAMENPQAQPQTPVTPTPLPPEPGSKPGSDISDVYLPVRAPVSSGFGMRRDPFTHQLRFHKGMDLAAPEGMEVRAALEGEVSFAGFKPGYGNTVIIQHPGGLETTYAHLGATTVKKGEVIAAEQVLGSVGNTGHSTGPHLHFEVSRWGELIDPRNALTD